MIELNGNMTDAEGVIITVVCSCSKHVDMKTARNGRVIGKCTDQIHGSKGLKYEIELDDVVLQTV